MQIIANSAVLIGILIIGVLFFFFTKTVQRINAKGNEKFGLKTSAKIQRSLASAIIYKIIGLIFIAISVITLILYVKRYLL